MPQDMLPSCFSAEILLKVILRRHLASLPGTESASVLFLFEQP